AQLVAPRLPAGGAVARVEPLVDGRRRFLRRAARDEDDDPVVLRQVERAQGRAVALAELWAALEEERHVGAEVRREPVQLRGRKRLLERLVRQPESCRGVRAPAAEPRRDRDPLPNPRRPARLDTGGRGDSLERGPDDGVLGESAHLEPRRRLDRDAVAEVNPLVDGAELVLAVSPLRPDDEREVEL